MRIGHGKQLPTAAARACPAWSRVARVAVVLLLGTAAMIAGAATMSAGTAIAQAGPEAAPVEPETAAADTTVAGEGVIDTARAWERVAAARDAAGEDRHHDAVADYLEALASDARLVPIVAQEIAYQKLWREDAVKSIFYFRRYLARHPGEENRDVRKGLAMAYSWSGYQPEAVALYRDLVAEDPADGAAAVGLGRSLLWNNELKEGWSTLRGVETQFAPDDPAGRESRDFQLVVLDTYTPPLELRLDASWDSDDLTTQRLTATGTSTVLGNKLLQVMPSFGRYSQPGQADIHNPRLGAAFHAALAHNWALHAFGWVNRFASSEPLFGGTEKLSWTTPGGDLWLTWLAAPRLRFDFGGNSAPVETFYALNNHLHYEQANLSADYRIARHVSASVGGRLASYSDDNTKRWGMARLTWRREGRWEIHAGPVFTYMDFTQPYPGGYWAPDWVRNGSLEVTLKTRTRHWTWRFNGSFGVEKELGADAATVGGASARAGWRFQPDWLLALEAGHSRSSFSSASGFNRTFVALSARAFF